MTATKPGRHKALLTVGAALVGLVAAAPGFAQETETQASPAAPLPTAAMAPVEPSTDATVNLIRLLVEQKVITVDAGQTLLAQAEAQAAQAQARIAATPPPPADGAVRVPYIPQVVRDQIRDEIRAEVMASAKTEGWVSPNTLPDWVGRVTIGGDVRFRSQSNLYSDANSNQVIDWDGFNNDGPTDILGAGFETPIGIPFINSRRDRTNQLSLRARLSVKAEVVEGVEAGIRLASGNNSGPVSTTQLLGGGFDKKDIWLDRAWITLQPAEFVSASFGRFANPFFSTDLLWDDDLNFDGAALTVNSAEAFGEDVSVFATGGAFPFEFTSNNFPTFSRDKAGRRDKYILGGQLGAEFKMGDSLEAKLGVAYYDFTNVRGQRSEPCALFEGIEQCSSDGSRPINLSKGNTLFLLRDIVPSADPSDISQPQFVGLLFDYNILDVNAEVSYALAEQLRLTATGNYIRNLAFDRDEVCEVAGALGPVNSLRGTQLGAIGTGNPCGAGGDLANFAGSGTAWMANLAIGTPELKKQGEWNVFGGYRRIGSDAVLDSLTDSDFHLGGTNAKGYTLGGNYMVLDHTRFGVRWLSANEISGEQLGIDVVQVDLVVDF